MMQHLALNIEEVEKKYVQHQVLKKFSLKVNAGDYLGLVGLNGAGKTTLMKCILDFSEINSGKIDIFGLSHTSVISREKLVFLPEKFLPPYYLTGNDFLIYICELYNVDFNIITIRELLKVVDLDASALEKSVRQYSKGMGQKLGLISCLLCNKELMIFDEPMSGLDPKARAYLKKYLLELKQDGKTLFFSTHLLNDVESICNVLAILHDGKIGFMGTPAECCEKYKTDDLEQAYLRCIVN